MNKQLNWQPSTYIPLISLFINGNTLKLTEMLYRGSIDSIMGLNNEELAMKLFSGEIPFSVR